MARQQGAAPQDVEAVHKKLLEFSRKFEEVSLGIRDVQLAYRKSLKTLYQDEARRLVEYQTADIAARFPIEAVHEFLEQVTEDLIEHRLESLDEEAAFTRLFQVNPVLTHDGAECPVIKETNPTLQNLLGTIDREFSSMGSFRSDHMMIHAGRCCAPMGVTWCLRPGTFSRSLAPGRSFCVPSRADSWRSYLRSLVISGPGQCSSPNRFRSTLRSS